MTAHRSRSLTVNVDDETLRKIDRHVAEHQPFLRRHAVHWTALNLGLTVLERKPELLLRFLSGEESQ